MKFEIPPLPYPKDALEPHISARTLELHYEKHHRGYLEKLRKLIEGKPESDLTLEELVVGSTGEVFNNAAQVWNHTFYWNSMKPGGGGQPEGELLQAIERDLGSFDACKRALAEAAVKEFGSGWAWLYRDRSGKLRVQSSDDAENPLQKPGQVPLLTIDVWEHAYYLDYQNQRDRYVAGVVDHLLDWHFAARMLAAARR